MRDFSHPAGLARILTPLAPPAPALLCRDAVQVDNSRDDEAMINHIRSGLLAAALTCLFAGTASAQVFTPTYTSPRLLNELGIYLSDGPGDLGVEGIWRGGPVGLRVGFVDAHGGLLSVGGEVRTPLPVTGAPLGLAFVAGAQGLIGDENVFGVQAGLTAGYTFRGTGTFFTPYMHPRVGMVNNFGGSSDMEFEVMADVGVDVEFWTNLIVRLGVSLDDVGANWGVGLAWRR
jgi:hypothetical protein